MFASTIFSHSAIFSPSSPAHAASFPRYRTLGRSAEARDAMTAALSMPIWTLGDVDLLDAAKVTLSFGHFVSYISLRVCRLRA
jgi:hypothetical protein